MSFLLRTYHWWHLSFRCLIHAILFPDPEKIRQLNEEIEAERLSKRSR